MNPLHFLVINPENTSILKTALDSLTVVETLKKILNFIPATLAQLIGSYVDCFEGQKAKALNCQSNMSKVDRGTPLQQAIDWKNPDAVALLEKDTDLSLKLDSEKSKTLKDELEEFETSISCSSDSSAIQ